MEVYNKYVKEKKSLVKFEIFGMFEELQGGPIGILENSSEFSLGPHDSERKNPSDSCTNNRGGFCASACLAQSKLARKTKLRTQRNIF